MIKATVTLFDTGELQKVLDQIRKRIEGRLRTAAQKMQKELQKAPPYSYYPWSSPESTGTVGGVNFYFKETKRGDIKVVHTSGGKYHSEKQRRYVMYHMDKGLWGDRPPYYKRQGKAAESWKYKEHIGRSKSTFTVYSDRRYHDGRVQYVQGDKQYWRMKAIGWSTTQQVFDKVWPNERRDLISAMTGNP